MELDGRLGPDAGEFLEHSDVGRVEDAKDEAIVLLLVLGTPVVPQLQGVNPRAWRRWRSHRLRRRQRLQHRNPFTPPQRGLRVHGGDGEDLERSPLIMSRSESHARNSFMSNFIPHCLTFT